MPEDFGLYNDLRVWEYLDFYADCFGIPEKERPALIGDLLELVDLSHKRDDKNALVAAVDQFAALFADQGQLDLVVQLLGAAAKLVP